MSDQIIEGDDKLRDAIEALTAARRQLGSALAETEPIAQRTLLALLRELIHLEVDSVAIHAQLADRLAHSLSLGDLVDELYGSTGPDSRAATLRRVLHVVKRAHGDR
jgi:hypothetical protein